MSRKLYHNGNFITLEDAMPKADYLICEDGIIKKLGSGQPSEDMKYDEKIDLKGKTVVPGFIDSHLHMLTGALTKLQIDLNDMKFSDTTEMMRYVKENAPVGKGWIRAFGFSEDNLDEPKIPSKEELDEIIPDRPVIITRVCGHLSVINTAAFAMLEQTKVESIEGGEFQRSENGDYSGTITEAAQQYVLDTIPAPTEEEISSKMEEEQTYLLSKGICSIHDAGTDQLLPHQYVEIYKKFNDSGRLFLRTYLMMRPEDDERFEDFADQVKTLRKEYAPEKSRLFFGAVKLFADGSLGGRTAAVRTPYVGEKDNKGLLLKERLDRYVPQVHKAGLQVSIHAIGDRSVEYCLDLIEQSMRNIPGQNIMHRIEHAEVLEEDLIKRIQASGVFIAAQPGFIWEFGSTYRKVIGENAEKIQPLKTLIKRGIPVGFGTDYPVIDANPVKGISAAVYRKVKNNPEPLNEEEGLSLNEALMSYTLKSAIGSGTEQLQGSLKIGKFADFAVLDKHIQAVSGAEELESTQVLATVIAGDILYQKEGSKNED